MSTPGERVDRAGSGPPSARTTTGSVSVTARAVAVGRAIGYRHLHDPMALSFLPRAERAIARRARRMASRAIGADAVAIATGGVSRHAALRMSAVDDAVIAAVRDGCQQVVVLGAGFDTRAWRLPDLADLPVHEVDMPATQAVKRASLEEPERVVFVEADLATVAVPEALAGTGHDPDRPTAWVWEAVAPYLPPAAVDGVLDGIRRVSATGGALAMTFVHPDLLGPRVLRPATGLLADLAFRALGEPIRSTYDEWDISALLNRHGFDSPTVTTAATWSRDAGLPGRPDLLGAEMLVTARVA